MAGEIIEINAAAEHGFKQTAHPSGRLVAEVGLEGDRQAGDGIVSIIEAEAVARFNETTGLAITAADTGRNLVTRGIRLNDLDGSRFRIGEATLEFFELCEPCATLGAHLSTETVSAADVVKAFTHSAGIRARVLTDGDIVPGTAIGTL